MDRGRIQGLPKFFEYPLLSRERIKLRTSNLAGVFTGPGPSEQKSFKILGEKEERGVPRDCRNFFSTTYYLGKG